MKRLLQAIKNQTESLKVYCELTPDGEQDQLDVETRGAYIEGMEFAVECMKREQGE